MDQCRNVYNEFHSNDVDVGVGHTLYHMIHLPTSLYIGTICECVCVWVGGWVGGCVTGYPCIKQSQAYSL